MDFLLFQSSDMHRSFWFSRILANIPKHGKALNRRGLRYSELSLAGRFTHSFPSSRRSFLVPDKQYSFSIVLLMCNTMWEMHLNCCLREICLVWVILTYITGTAPLASGEHQVEVELILMCYQQCLVDFSAVGQGNTRMSTSAAETAKYLHSAGDGSITSSSGTQHLPACQTVSTVWYLSKLISS